MPSVVDDLLRSSTLSGARIWLSGSIPEADFISEEKRSAIRNFVPRVFPRVLQQDGHIVHGSHPSFTPILLEEARSHQNRGGGKDCLILAVSRLWSKDPTAVPVSEWRKTAIVYEVPEVTGQNARNDSLELLRKW